MRAFAAESMPANGARVFVYLMLRDVAVIYNSGLYRALSSPSDNFVVQVDSPQGVAASERS